ncbi:two-component sensor histidine kinase [Amycolatopsis coloradensis]|uniref:histidine kinase n=1 Tax=Amycolatopsis coloradensis TaxID=76021 RepID=A0A1R0L0R9_9PSEU|nr:HAMP domain-containing sensor histidine kinase [Amycolatopsis coloradensis]OLZ55413.1 two-component sensor histidine kinase [Amycolatopsis coloradensis]
MSSSPRAERPWSLRRRLIAQVAGLLALVCLVVGVATELALRDFLIDQLDSRLDETSQRASRPPPPGRPGGERVPEGLRAYGQSTGSLFVNVFPDGRVLAAVLRSSYDAKVTDPFPHDEITRAQVDTLVRSKPGNEPTDVDLGSLGEYRVVAKQTSNGGIAITGLPTKDVTDTLWNLGFIFGGVAIGGILLAGALGAVTVRRTMKPLDRLAATASRVAELPLDRGEVALSERVSEVDTDPRTEVGKVGFALNRMLGHISHALSARQASESRVRRFVADASHELRTPLAAIRGYAELTRRSGSEVPPDIAFAMGRVESESTRMTGLVEDLLLLARLDSGRPVVRGPVDLSRLVADAVADAHVAGPGHKWLLEVPPEPITVLGDADQLHQVVINLLGNARTHTPAGTEVATSLSIVDSVVTLSIVDGGPGIPPEILPDVFERFARGDDSRSRAAGSTGLGLAIVAAVVAAHDGQVRVASLPGRTEFQVRFRAA